MEDKMEGCPNVYYCQLKFFYGIPTLTEKMRKFVCFLIIFFAISDSL